jgi:ubiquinone/menaquinone biosynthesis C-methylase UbiE
VPVDPAHRSTGDSAVNCDALAPWYSTLEYLSFGSALLACRFRQLPHCRAAKSALMLGDGDGRFLKRFLREADQAEVDYVDCSGQMLALARSRLTSEMRERVRFHKLTAHEFQPYKQYDLARISHQSRFMVMVLSRKRPLFRA